jgi:rubrerythrin
MSITLAQAIKNAIAAEQSAEEFYLHLAQVCAEPHGQAILMGIAAEERRHAAALQGVAERLVAGQLPARADALVKGIETSPAGLAAEGLELAEALEIALDAENSATLYYDALATTASGEAAAFFARMSQEEDGHARVIRGMLAGLAA